MPVTDLPALSDEVGKRGIILIFAPSERAPAYEAQVRLLDEDLEAVETSNVLLVSVLTQGESRIGERRIEPDEATRLQEALSVEPDEFKIVVLGPDGSIVRRDDAPLRITALLASSASS